MHAVPKGESNDKGTNELPVPSKVTSGAHQLPHPEFSPKSCFVKGWLKEYLRTLLPEAFLCTVTRVQANKNN